VKAEAKIELQAYLDRAPDPAKDKLRYEWHILRYRFALTLKADAARMGDVGCGWGFGSDLLACSGAEVLAFDLNPQVVDYARERIDKPNVSFATHDILSGPLPGGNYDLICMFEVIEHLEDPDKGLKHLHASLARGGLVVLSTPNGLVRRTEDMDPHPFHSKEFTPSDLEPLLRRNFSDVQLFSQGNQLSLDEYYTKAKQHPMLGLIRSLDPLAIRGRLPSRLRRSVRNQAVGMNVERIMAESIQVRPGWNNNAEWLLAVCSDSDLRS
jgi:SAM-dependent methyltransferase